MSTVSSPPPPSENLRQFEQLLTQSRQEVEFCAKLTSECSNSEIGSPSIRELDRNFFTLTEHSKELSCRLRLLSIVDSKRHEFVAKVKSVQRDLLSLFPIITSLLELERIGDKNRKAKLESPNFRRALDERVASISKASQRTRPATIPKFMKKAEDSMTCSLAPRACVDSRLEDLTALHETALKNWMNSHTQMLATRAESIAAHGKSIAAIENEKQNVIARLAELHAKYREEVFALETVRERLLVRLLGVREASHIITVYTDLQNQHRELQIQLTNLPFKKTMQMTKLREKIRALQGILAAKQALLREAQDTVPAEPSTCLSRVEEAIDDATPGLDQQIEGLQQRIKDMSAKLARLNPGYDALAKRKRKELDEIKAKLSAHLIHYEAANKQRDTLNTQEDDLKMAINAIDKDLVEKLPSRFARQKQKLRRRIESIQFNIREKQRMHEFNMLELNKLVTEAEQEIADLQGKLSIEVEKIKRRASVAS